MRRDELPLVTLDLRHAGALLAHPCGCGHKHCNLGDHLWAATIDMVPGPRAQTTDPRGRSWLANTDDVDPGVDPGVDPTRTIDMTYRRLLGDAQHAAQALCSFVEKHRPDRHVPDLDDPQTDADACRNHLDQLGIWEPRSRGDLCNFCGSYSETTNRLPNRLILNAHHEGRHREVDRLIALDEAETARKKAAKKRRKARR